MTIQIANVVQSTDTFGQWLSKTNQAIYAMTTKVVTTNSNTTVGNASITGTFTSNNLSLNVNSNSSLFIGATGSLSNVVANSTFFTMRSSVTTNTVYSANGLVINGSVFYTSALMKIGNTTIRSGNITSDQVFSKFIRVGNSFITNSTMYADYTNTTILYVSNNATIGDNQANVYMDRWGLGIASNPTGTAVVNSRMTSTTLWINDIYANNLTIRGNFYANNIYANNIYTGNLKVDFVTSNVVFQRSITVLGPTNHFAQGLTSNTFVGIGPGHKSPGAMLHIVNPAAPTGAVVGVNTKANILIDSDTDSIVQFRGTPDNGTFHGLVFSDNNTHAGYVVYRHPAASGVVPGQATLCLGGEKAIALGVQEKPNINLPVDLKTTKLHIEADRSTFYNDIYVTNGTGSIAIKPPASGMSTFIMPPNNGTANQYLKTDGAGNMSWSDVIIPGKNDCVEYFSLGVGGPSPTCQQGLITATGDIIAFWSDDRLKEKIGNIENALDKVKSLSGFIYKNNEEAAKLGFYDNEERVGLSAQQVKAVLPQAVKPAPIDLTVDEKTGQTVSKSGKDYLTVQYEKVVPLLVEAIKELDDKLESIKSLLEGK